MANITGASLEPIYQRLSDAPQYHPMEAETFADWSLEAGDIVTITRDGKAYQSPVHTSKINWRKKQMVTLSSTGNEKRESISRISQRKFSRGSGGLRASNERYQEIITSYNEMTSGLILASSSAALYVDNRYTQMTAGLNLTSSTAALYVDNKYSQMRAGLDLTSSSAALYVDNKYSQMKAGLDLTSSSASMYVDNKYAQMKAGLDLTSSSASLYVDNKYNQMKSGLDLTSSSASLYVDNKYNALKAGLDLTSSSAALYVDNKYAQMSAGLNLTSSSAALYVDNKYNQMKSGLDLTSSSASLYVDNKYNALKAGLDLTSSSAALYVDNKYAQMSAGLNLTSSSAALYVDNKYNQMKSGLDLTSSSASLYVDNKYNELKAGLDLTSSSASLYVDNKYNELKAGLDLTSSSASLYVDNKYNEMKAGLDITSSSAALYARSAENAAEIAARINESTGESEIHLDAQKVYIGNQKSTTVINGKCSLSDVTADYISTQLASVAQLTVNGLNVVGDCYVRNADGNQQNIANAIWTLDIAQSGNTYTLRRKRVNDSDWVDVGSFSRATALSGAWSGGELTVSASPQGNTFKADLFTGGHWGYAEGESTTTYYGSISAKHNGGSTSYTTGEYFEVDASSIYTSGLSDYYYSSYWAKATSANNWNAKVPNVTNTAAEDWNCGASDAYQAGLSASTSLSGAWDSGILTVTASPQGKKFKADLFTGGHWGYAQGESPTTYYGSISAKHNGGDTSYSTGEYFNVDASSIYTSGYAGYYDSGYWKAPSDNNGTCLIPKRDGSGSETWFTLSVNIPSTQIYTTDRNPQGTKLTTLRDKFIQAQRDSEYVCFRIDCGGVQKWYYMEP